MTFGKRLRILREALDWTQTMMGKKLGVSRTAICSWELGVCEPRKPLKKLVEMWMDQKESGTKTGRLPVDSPNLSNQKINPEDVLIDRVKAGAPFKPSMPDRTALKQLKALVASDDDGQTKPLKWGN